MQQYPSMIGTALPKTPNDIYGLAQKAVLHSIFDKGSVIN